MIRTRSIPFNPPLKRKARTVRSAPRAKLHATVHWGGVWIQGDYVAVGPSQQKRLVKALLNAGIPVRGYWADINYSSIDRRIGPGVRPGRISPEGAAAPDAT